MMKRFGTLWVILFLLTILLSATAHARRLKVYHLPASIVPGQLGIIIFENPDVIHPVTRTACTAPRLIGWVKSDIPILRIEQNGKEVWTSLGSYQSVGDSCIATFMAPLTLQPGRATLFLTNGMDASIPYYFTVGTKPEATLTGVGTPAGALGGTIKPLGKFTIVGDGFVPEGSVNEQKARQELEANLGLSHLPPAEQWTDVNHRIMKDWDKLPTGNFLYYEQDGKTWRGFVETCGLQFFTNDRTSGMTLDFIAPPDLRPGPITLTLGIRMNGAEVFRTKPITATVAP